ncbi:hypothetical protein ACFVX6_17370 [Streptomyces sp. NPDC058289]
MSTVAASAGAGFTAKSMPIASVAATTAANRDHQRCLCGAAGEAAP